MTRMLPKVPGRDCKSRKKRTDSGGCILSQSGLLALSLIQLVNLSAYGALSQVPERVGQLLRLFNLYKELTHVSLLLTIDGRVVTYQSFYFCKVSKSLAWSQCNRVPGRPVSAVTSFCMAASSHVPAVGGPLRYLLLTQSSV